MDEFCNLALVKECGTSAKQLIFKPRRIFLFRLGASLSYSLDLILCFLDVFIVAERFRKKLTAEGQSLTGPAKPLSVVLADSKETLADPSRNLG